MEQETFQLAMGSAATAVLAAMVGAFAVAFRAISDRAARQVGEMRIRQLEEDNVALMKEIARLRAAAQLPGGSR